MVTVMHANITHPHGRANRHFTPGWLKRRSAQEPRAETQGTPTLRQVSVTPHKLTG